MQNYCEDSSDLSSVPESALNDRVVAESAPLRKRKRTRADEGKNPTSVQKAHSSRLGRETRLKDDTQEERQTVPSSEKQASETEIEVQITNNHTNAKPKTVPKKRARWAEDSSISATDEPVAPDVVTSSATVPSIKASKARKKKENQREVKDEDKPDKQDTTETAKPKRKRKTKEEKEAALAPMATRTIGSKMLVGAHVSSGGGVHNAIANANRIGGNAFALFLKSQRKWDNPPLKPEHATAFAALSAEHSYPSATAVLPHGSYLVNLAAADGAKAEQAYTCFVDDLRRCETLGIRLYNFHPGNTNGQPRAEALGRIAVQLNRAHEQTNGVITLLENMAASPQGNCIGGAWEDLRDIISAVKDKSRVGVCLDTCHAFAAGFDLRSPEAYASTMASFDSIVGPEYLKAVHMNDSKAPLGAHRDLHQCIGLGFLGLRAFHNVMNDLRFQGIPLILETPDDKGWATEVKLLESLVGMDVEGDEFTRLEAELASKGNVEREKYQEAFHRKQEKDRKASKKGLKREKGKRGQRKNAEEDNSDEPSELSSASDDDV